jgi:hypothetical protein
MLNQMTKRPAKKPSSPATVSRGKPRVNKKKMNQDEEERDSEDVGDAEELSKQNKRRKVYGKK